MGINKKSVAKMSWKWTFFALVICTLGMLGHGQDYEDGEVGPRSPLRSCTYRRQQGYCVRRSECARPTRNICRFGLNPIVCCMDQPELKTTSTTTTTRRPATTRRSPAKPDSVRTLDLTFPGCGSRTPKVPSNTRPSSNTNRRGGSLFNRGQGSINPVIVGGVTAKANSWPWMVAIFKQTSERTPKRFLCGASLISKKYVLSAAHCFDGEKGNIDASKFFVVVGSHNTKDGTEYPVQKRRLQVLRGGRIAQHERRNRLPGAEDNGPPRLQAADASKFFVVVGSHNTKDGTEYPVQKVTVHPGYKQRQYYNDISLVRVQNEVQLTQKVYPVCVPSDGLRDKITTTNNDVTVTGWGDTSFGGVSSQVLQELTIPIVPLKECNASYSKLLLTSFPDGITNLFICAGVEEGGKDACQGDSGGPLVSKLKDGTWVQLGVVSFGYGCAQPGYPGVYTRVSQYSKWLYDNTDLGKA